VQPGARIGGSSWRVVASIGHCLASLVLLWSALSTVVQFERSLYMHATERCPAVNEAEYDWNCARGILENGPLNLERTKLIVSFCLGATGMALMAAKRGPARLAMGLLLLFTVFWIALLRWNAQEADRFRDGRITILGSAQVSGAWNSGQSIKA
jgi:hypothetical protein